MRLDMERIIAGAVLALGLFLAAPGIGTAQAVPLVGCEHREPGHVDKHGGQLVDDEYHRSRGESVTCVPAETDTGSGSDETHKRPDNDNQAEGKSRYCRRHFWC